MARLPELQAVRGLTYRHTPCYVRLVTILHTEGAPRCVAFTSCDVTPGPWAVRNWRHDPKPPTRRRHGPHRGHQIRQGFDPGDAARRPGARLRAALPGAAGPLHPRRPCARPLTPA